MADRSPKSEEIIDFEESTLPTYRGQYNDYALSDIPEKNGRWYTYWRIPEESSSFSAGETFGGGWSAKTAGGEAGMEIADESQPTYEGMTETAWTNTTIYPPPDESNWTGASSWGMEGSTCVGLQSLPGNINTGAC